MRLQFKILDCLHKVVFITKAYELRYIGLEEMKGQIKFTHLHYVLIAKYYWIIANIMPVIVNEVDDYSWHDMSAWVSPCYMSLDCASMLKPGKSHLGWPKDVYWWADIQICLLVSWFYKIWCLRHMFTINKLYSNKL